MTLAAAAERGSSLFDEGFAKYDAGNMPFPEKLTTEKLKDRLDRLLKDMEHAADLTEQEAERPSAPRAGPRARRKAGR